MEMNQRPKNHPSPHIQTHPSLKNKYNSRNDVLRLMYTGLSFGLSELIVSS